MRFELLAFTALVGVASCKNAVKMPDAEPVVAKRTGLGPLDVDEFKVEVLEKVPAQECKMRSGPGSVVVTLYNAELIDGKIIDKSWDNNDPHQFQLGTPLVIEGLQQGLEDMCVGEVRKVTIPSRLGHGGKIGGGGLIPANAGLIYKVKLIGLMPPFYVNPEYKDPPKEDVTVTVTETATPAGRDESYTPPPPKAETVTKDEL